MTLVESKDRNYGDGNKHNNSRSLASFMRSLFKDDLNYHEFTIHLCAVFVFVVISSQRVSKTFQSPTLM